MKKLFAVMLALLFSVSAYAQTIIIAKKTTASNLIFYSDFEDATDDAEWGTLPASWNDDYTTNPLEGSESLINAQSDTEHISDTFTAQSGTLYGRFSFRTNSTTGHVDENNALTFRIKSDADTIAGCFLYWLFTDHYQLKAMDGYSGQATGIASLATIGRVALTALLSPLFCLAGLVGPVWAVVALTLPVGLEAVVSWAFARPFLRDLPGEQQQPPRLRDIFWFSLPLTVGGYCLSLATVILAGIVARAAEPERMIPVYYLALGLASPVAFAASRLQTIVLAFPPADQYRRQTMRFALAAGFILGPLPLTFILPGLDELYYVQLQNLNPVDLEWVRPTAAVLVLLPLAVALRGQSEGLAAWLKKPLIVLLGQAAFLLTASAAGATALIAGLPGCLIGAASLPLGSLASSAAMRLALNIRL